MSILAAPECISVSAACRVSQWGSRMHDRRVSSTYRHAWQDRDDLVPIAASQYGFRIVTLPLLAG